MNRFGIFAAVTAWAAIVFVPVQDLWSTPTEQAQPSNKRKSQERSRAEVVLPRAGDGHFYIDADVNGASIRMLADTGASLVVLSAHDAEEAGIDVDQLDFNRLVMTANGHAAVARVQLDEVRVGSIARQDVPAMVARGLDGSLLGMSFFSQLSSVTMESDELVLRD
jgi:aspartyl protease family protein